MPKEPKKETKKESKADFSKSMADLNDVNFRNKDVVTWQEKTARKRGMNGVPRISGLKGLGSRTKAPRLK